MRAGLAAAHQGFERVDQLQREISELSLALEERKLVERAKGLLMERFGLIEETARAKLRDRALTDGSSLAEAARAVVKDLTVHNPRPHCGAEA